MPKNIHIREAKIQDKPVILSLIKSYSSHDFKFAKRYYDNYFCDDPVTNEDLVLVAEINNKVVGVIGYCEDYFCNEYSYHLNWLVVAERYRGWQSGIVAEKLLSAVEKDLRRYKVKKLFVGTIDKLERCHGFYLKHGFQFEASLKDYYSKGEDQIIFGKQL